MTWPGRPAFRAANLPDHRTSSPGRTLVTRSTWRPFNESLSGRTPTREPKAQTQRRPSDRLCLPRRIPGKNHKKITGMT
jgi:hypothetical protein